MICVTCIVISLLDDLVRVNLFIVFRSCSVADGQCSLNLGDVIVASLGSFIQSVGECICAAADQCLGSGNIIFCAFAFCESLAADCYCVISECCSVINFSVISRCQCY